MTAQSAAGRVVRVGAGRRFVRIDGAVAIARRRDDVAAPGRLHDGDDKLCNQQRTQRDIIREIGATRRQVLNREHEGRPARIVVASRTYDTTIDDVWDAITNAQRIPRWFLPISGDLQLGGRYQLEGNAGGTIKRCEPPRVLGLTWEYGGDISWVDVRLTDDPNGGTRLELEHIARVGDKKWDEFGPGAVGVGWDLSLHGLGLHLSTGAAVDPAAAAAWTTSDEGKTFMRGSSDDWCRASIAAGTDPDAAKAAAARTNAAYAGET